MKSTEYLRTSMIPDFDSPVSTTRHENLWMKMIPSYRVNSHVVGLRKTKKQIINCVAFMRNILLSSCIGYLFYYYSRALNFL